MSTKLQSISRDTEERSIVGVRNHMIPRLRLLRYINMRQLQNGIRSSFKNNTQTGKTFLLVKNKDVYYCRNHESC